MVKLTHCKTGDILELPDLIPLQNCHMTQYGSGAKKKDWSVEENITNKQLISFPSRFNEKEMFSIIKFARKYELEAFNTGINFQKNKQNIYLKATINELQKNNADLADENIRLATVLDNFTSKGVT